jgi:Tfp pilus assembly protein PilN
MSVGIAILSAAVTVFALVLSIFGASWLNQRNTERLLEQLAQRLDQRIDSLEKRFDQRIDSLEKRLDQRLDGVDQRLDRMERQLEAIFKPIIPK